MVWLLPDRQRRVFVGTVGQRLVDEQVTRCTANDFQHLGVGNAFLIQTLNQALAGPLRGHPDAATQHIVLFTSH